MSNTPKLKPGQSLPKRFELTLTYRIKPSWKKRILILIGYSVQADVKVRIDKHTGQVWQEASMTVSPLPPTTTKDDLTEPTTK